MTEDTPETSGVDAAPHVLEILRRSRRTGCLISHIDQLTGCTKTSTDTSKIPETG